MTRLPVLFLAAALTACASTADPAVDLLAACSNAIRSPEAMVPAEQRAAVLHLERSIRDDCATSLDAEPAVIRKATSRVRAFAARRDALLIGGHQ